MKVLLIVPAYNEEDSIEKVVDNLIVNYPEYDYVIINDASTDSMLDILKRKNYNYLNLPINLGIGGGVQAGYKYAQEYNYDIAIQLDGDGQHDPSYISKLLKEFEKDKSLDIVIGSRFIEKTGFQSSLLRRIGIKFLSELIKLLSKTKIFDVTSGLRASSTNAISFFAKNYANDYPEPEAIMAATLNGFIIKEVAVEMKERQGGTSSINALRGLYYMIKVSLALIVCRISYSKKEAK